MAQEKFGDRRLYSIILASPIDTGYSCLLKCKGTSKEIGRKAIRVILNRLKLRVAASVDITPPEPSYRVIYLGNVITGWAKGDNSVEKPLNTLWKNYIRSQRADVRMQLVVSGGGLKATTNDHGLTEYWANRISFCAAPLLFPRLFCWIYRHEGRKLRHELRCHAVLCSSALTARKLAQQLKDSLAQALAEFKRDKLARQNSRLSLVNSCWENPSLPRRKILLSTGTANYKPPLERSKSAPKLTIIEENLREEDNEEERIEGQKAKKSGRSANGSIECKARIPPHLRKMKHSESASLLLEKNFRFRSDFNNRKDLLARLPKLNSFGNLRQFPSNPVIFERDDEDKCDDEYQLNKTKLATCHEDHGECNNNKKGTCDNEDDHPIPFAKRNFSFRRGKNRSANNSLSDSCESFAGFGNISENQFVESVSCDNLTDVENITIEVENCDNLQLEHLDNSELIDAIIQSSNLMTETKDQIKVKYWLRESDDNSMSSSGCESGSSTHSDVETANLQTHPENANSSDFKINCMYARSRHNHPNIEFERIDNAEVSLVPVGELSNDFSSLKIYRRKSLEKLEKLEQFQQTKNALGKDEQNDSSSDESGYVEACENVDEKSADV